MTRYMVLAWSVLDLLACLPTAAQSRPRDDVMVGAFRCNAIADNRIWLQCAYGAAQPLRAQLGLPDVTDAQLKLARLPPTAGTGSMSTVRNIAIMGAARCSAIGDDRQWLDCYYGAMQPVRAALGMVAAPQARLVPPSPAGAVGGIDPSPPARVRQDGFFSDLLGTGGHGVHARMVAYNFDHFKDFTVTLDDGEVWRQLAGDGAFAVWRKKPSNYQVAITEGSLGSFNLRVNGEDRFYKVQRVK